MGCFSCFNKLFLVVLNFIVFLIGTGIVALASVVIHKGQVYQDILINSGIVSLPMIVLIIGLLIAVIGFFGCCGAVRENPCMLYTYATVVLFLFLAGLVVGILILLYPNKAKDSIKDSMQKSWNKYNAEDPSLSKVVDSIQHDFKCCGIDSSNDWKNTPYGKIPTSCCLDSSDCNVNLSDDIFKVGCYDAMYDEIKGAAKILGISAVVLAIVQFMCICIACGLAKKRSQYV